MHKFLFISLLLLLAFTQAFAQSKPQRVVIIMVDGFGEDYYRAGNMPNLNDMEKQGLYKVVPSLMPAVTNVNTVSIVTGETPAKHGVTGNVYLNPTTGKEDYVEDPALVLIPTIFTRAKAKGVESVLLSVKKKSVDLFSPNTVASTCPECDNAQTSEWAKAFGAPPAVYTKEASYWVLKAAAYTLEKHPEIGLVFVHTTDYPMHTWAPEEADAKDFLHNLDSCIGVIRKTAPDAAILVTADHGLNHKGRCYDLANVLISKQLPASIVISPENDRYVKHHRGMGGTAYVYLKDIKDLDATRNIIKALPGVEKVLTRAEAAKEFKLMPEHIGDLVVTGDKMTVFGGLDKEKTEVLPGTYRSHGSAYEAHVPLFIYNAKNAPKAGYFDWNYKVAAWLYK